MDELRRQVRRARFWLGLQRFVGVLAWGWFATLLAALGLITLDKYYPLGVPAWAWAGGALGGGLAAAAIWISATRREALVAAIEIDRRFALKERVSSALALTPEDRQSEAGAALIDDAVRRVQRIDVGSRFGVAPRKSWLLPLVPGALSVLVALLVNPAAETPAEANTPAPLAKQEVKKASDTLRRQLAERASEAKKAGLKEAERLLKKLEEGSKELAEGKTERDKALVKLNDLARELQERRKELGAGEKMKQQLNQLKDLDRGPADKFAKAVREGDFQKAAEELRKIKNELANSKLDQQQKQDLARQLDQMQEKLNKFAAAHKQVQDELKQRQDQLRKAGQAAEADKLQQQLDKLLEQAPQIAQMQELADKLAQCAQNLREGQVQDAEKALDDLQAKLEDLLQQADEMEMLDQAMEQLAQARAQMTCPICGGFG